MKKLILVLLLAGAAVVGYRWRQSSGAFNAYEGFAEAWTTGDKTGAMKYGLADTATRALEKQSLRGLQSGSIIEAYRGTRYTVESTVRSDDGEVLLEVMQTIHFDPPGVTSGINGAMYTHIHHSATVRKTPDGWKVVTFEPKYVDMGELRKRGS